jgi:urease accessory protein
VIARTTAVVEPGGVLGAVTCAPPLTLRQVHSEQAPPTTPTLHNERRCELRLVGTAAGPLAGDDLALSLRLLPGARATLRAAGASVAQGAGGDRTLAIRAELGNGADLIAEPGPLIACAGSRVEVRVEIVLSAGAAVDWREVVVLGRIGEAPGQVTLRWDVTRGGEPVLRQFADLGPALYRGGRVLACALISDPAASVRTAVESASAVAQRVNDHTVLVSVLEDDAARAVRRLGVLCAQARS